jgi:hypothetical protein
VGEALQDYNLISIFKKQMNYYKKMFKETKKLKTQTTREMNK